MKQLRVLTEWTAQINSPTDLDALKSYANTAVEIQRAARHLDRAKDILLGINTQGNNDENDTRHSSCSPYPRKDNPLFEGLRKRKKTAKASRYR